MEWRESGLIRYVGCTIRDEKLYSFYFRIINTVEMWIFYEMKNLAVFNL